MIKRMSVFFLYLLCIALIGAAIKLGLYIARKPIAIDPPVHSSSFSEENHLDTLIGGPFKLMDLDGQTWTNTDINGRYTFVYFGYTFCPDICPMALTSLSTLLANLKRNRDDVRVIFITVDPTRDTPDLLKTYRQHFHPDIIMLTGSSSAIEGAKQSYKVYAAKQETKDSTDYLMDHSTFIYLMNREGKFIQHFPHTVSADVLIDTTTRLLAKDAKVKQALS